LGLGGFWGLGGFRAFFWGGGGVGGGAGVSLPQTRRPLVDRQKKRRGRWGMFGQLTQAKGCIGKNAHSKEAEKTPGTALAERPRVGSREKSVMAGCPSEEIRMA